MQQEKFEFLMVSAGFEHGGNVTHRFLDGHPELYVYPFESQLGNRSFVDFLSSLERPQYRYPEFSTNGTPVEDYEMFYDEELKTLLRKPNGSKFSKFCDLQMEEQDRIENFVKHLEGKPRTRGNIIEAFFRATFDAWKNYQRSGKNHVYVGYCPIIGIDSDRIVADFPAAHILHVVRNPFSAYSDTKKRPFPLSLRRYAISWNLYHHLVLMHQQQFPNNISIIRYEDLIANPEATLTPICQKVGIAFEKTMLYPSWNGKDISEQIYPWGTIKRATPEANLAAMDELTSQEKSELASICSMMLRLFEYDKIKEIATVSSDRVTA